MRYFGLIVDISCMGLVYLSFFMPKWSRRGFESLFAGTLMYVYLCCVIYFTLMPVFASLPNIILGPRGTINMHPFRDLFHGYGDYMRQILLNILMLVPMGILYPISRGNRGFGMTVLAGFIFSTAIEVMQPLLHAERCFDITDIITNTMGAALGYAILAVFRPLLALIFPRALGKNRGKKKSS